MKTWRYLIVGGILGPILFATTVTLVGSSRATYDHRTQFISELGEVGGLYSEVMNYLGFMIPALFIMLFAVSLMAGYSKTKLTGFASFLIVLFAAGMFLAGVFSCDSTCLPANPTREHILHNLFSFMAFLSLIIGCMLWGIFLRRNSEWTSFGVYSIITSVLAIVLLALMVATAASRNETGLFQRLFLLTLFTWMALFAYRLWRIDPSWISVKK